MVCRDCGSKWCGPNFCTFLRICFCTFLKHCREILKKLSLNPRIDDDFIDYNFSLQDYINEIVRSFLEISDKEFTFKANG